MKHWLGLSVVSALSLQLLACGGAHKPKYYDFGGASGEAAKGVRNNMIGDMRYSGVTYTNLVISFFLDAFMRMKDIHSKKEGSHLADSQV